jgi:cardiolipin synthase
MTLQTKGSEAVARGAGGLAAGAGLRGVVEEDDGWVAPPPVRLGDGTTVRLFKDGSALAAAYDAIRAARRQVLLEVYIFAGDDTGAKFAEALMERARAGVPVYLIYDAFGSAYTPREMFRDMRRAGVRMQVFHPVRPWECSFSWRPFNRDHRKLLVIDNHVAGMGGLNVGAEYAGSWLSRRAAQKGKPVVASWRDNAIGVRGPAVRVLRECFVRTWRYCAEGGRIARAMTLEPPVADARNFSVPTEGEHFSLLASVPTMDSPLRTSLHRLFGGARESIRMTMAYFAPDDDLIDALCRAAKRGVRVQLMLPGKCDVPILVTAARSFYDTLIRAGVEIFERQAVVLHAKTMVIDGNVSVIGSTNLDYRSIEYNLEMSAVITSRTFAGQMIELFENDVRHAMRIDPARWERRAFVDRIGQWAVSRARYLL